MRTIHYVERLPSLTVDGRTAGGRHINHDPRSLAYEHPRTNRAVADVSHKRTVGPFDQGQLGSCTGNAMAGALLTEPFAGTWTPGARTITADEAGAVKLYEQATAIDPYPGTYPPTDTGSDGTSVAQAAKNLGLIAGYRHVLSGLTTALQALQDVPVITGVSWYEDMFHPDADGRVHVGGQLAGGHEFEVFGVDVDNRRIWCWQSWGPGFGVGGTFYLTWEDWDGLLADKGDVTVPIPLTQPAPTPTPDADHALAAVARPWIARHHTSIAGNATMQAALRTWLHAKGL